LIASAERWISGPSSWSERAVDRLTGVQDVAGSSPAPLNADQHVGLQLDCLIGSRRLGSMLIFA